MCPPELFGECLFGFLHRPNHVDHVNGQPDGAGLVAESPGDCLPDPPGRIRGELESFSPIELLDRPDEPEVAFLNEIQQVQPPARIPLGDRDHQPEVRPDERGLGRLPLAQGLEFG